MLGPRLSSVKIRGTMTDKGDALEPRYRRTVQSTWVAFGVALVAVGALKEPLAFWFTPLVVVVFLLDTRLKGFVQPDGRLDLSRSARDTRIIVLVAMFAGLSALGAAAALTDSFGWAQRRTGTAQLVDLISKEKRAGLDTTRRMIDIQETGGSPKTAVLILRPTRKRRFQSDELRIYSVGDWSLNREFAWQPAPVKRPTGLSRALGFKGPDPLSIRITSVRDLDGDGTLEVFAAVDELAGGYYSITSFPVMIRWEPASSHYTVEPLLPSSRTEVGGFSTTDASGRTITRKIFRDVAAPYIPNSHSPTGADRKRLKFLRRKVYFRDVRSGHGFWDHAVDAFDIRRYSSLTVLMGAYLLDLFTTRKERRVEVVHWFLYPPDTDKNGRRMFSGAGACQPELGPTLRRQITIIRLRGAVDLTKLLARQWKVRGGFFDC
jgi:hypothetical protein